MEVIQWTKLWEFFKDEYENEKNFLGGALGTKAAEDLKLRIIEHVLFNWLALYVYLVFLPLCLSIDFQFLLCSEYLGCFKVLFKDHPEEDCGSSLLELAGLYFLPLL
jgi:hypothetical protein